MKVVLRRARLFEIQSSIYTFFCSVEIYKIIEYRYTLIRTCKIFKQTGIASPEFERAETRRKTFVAAEGLAIFFRSHLKRLSVSNLQSFDTANLCKNFGVSKDAT